MGGDSQMSGGQHSVDWEIGLLVSTEVSGGPVWGGEPSQLSGSLANWLFMQVSYNELCASFKMVGNPNNPTLSAG